MIKIISHTPVYVWFLLAYLLWGGWRARKTYVVAWKTLFLMPAVMFAWSMYSVLAHYGLIPLCLWAISITLGMWLGTLTIRGLALRFDKQRKLIEIAGNRGPMILSMAIFSLRYFLGGTYGLHPELVGNAALEVLENGATVVSGMFTGRLIGYWQRSKTAPHTDLAEAKG